MRRPVQFQAGARSRFARRAGVVALLLAAPSLARAAADSPQALVGSVYALYAKSGGAGMPADEKSLDRYMEPALAKAWSNNAKAGETSDSLDDVIDSDPFVGGQDFKVTGLQIGAPVEKNGHTQVVATFRNFGKPVRVVYDLVPAGAEWRIFDLHRGRDPGLRHLLKLDAVPPKP